MLISNTIYNSRGVELKMNLKEQINIKDEENYAKFDAMMNAAIELAEELHGYAGGLTENERIFLDKFDKYMESAHELNELEEQLEQQ